MRASNQSRCWARARNAGAAIAVLALVAGPGASQAAAGSYDVTACNSAPGAVNNSWIPLTFNSGGASPLPSTSYTCPAADAEITKGMRALLGGGSFHLATEAKWTFSAPSGTSISQITKSWHLYRSAASFRIGLFVNDTISTSLLDGYLAGQSPATVDTGPTFTPLSTLTIPSGTTATSLILTVSCGAQGCGGTADLGLQQVSVRVQDPSSPSVSSSGGTIPSGSPVRGSGTVSYDATDNVGIRDAQLQVDGQTRATDSRACDYTQPAPCSNVTGGSLSFDTSVLTDGSHNYVVEATDAAGNVAQTASGSFNSSNAPLATVAPSISGAARDEETLTSNDGQWDSPSSVTYSRQWQRCDGQGGNCVDVAGKTSTTYSVSASDIGSRLRLKVTATNRSGSTQATSAATAVVVAAPPANSALPAISGTAREGDTLTGDRGTWHGTAPLSFGYQWQRCDSTDQATCADIAGATDAAYTAARADVGKWLRFEVTATNSVGAASAISVPAGAVEAMIPANTSTPTISGTARDSLTLTADDGSWTGTPPISFSYQWRACLASDPSNCSDISGATAKTYTLTSAEVGKRMRVAVTASNSGGSATAESGPSATVAAVAPGNTSLPTISGTPTDGNRLSANDGSWTGSTPISFSRQWQGCDSGGACADIAGATGTTYRLTSSDVGERIRIKVTATNAGGSLTATSAMTNTVAAMPPSNLTAPTVSGKTTSEQALTAGGGAWRGSSPMAFAYQWQRCLLSCADVEGATASTYVLTALDVGAGIRVRVTASNSAGSATAYSAVTDRVQPAPPSHPPWNQEAPSISGTAADGEALNAAPGAWQGSQPMAFEYQWLRCDAAGDFCSEIPAAVQQNYTIQSADIGATLRIRVTATNPVASTAADSSQTGVVVAVAPTNTTPPQIVGVPRQGFPLRATSGDWTGSTPIAYAYRWQRCTAGGLCDDIAGAPAETYTPRAEDHGYLLQVRVTATNPGGSTSATSARAGPVDG